MKIENRTELKEYRIECQKKQSADCRVLVCGGTGCLASGSGKIYEKLKELTKDHTGVEVKIGEEIAHTKVMKSGCHGFCEMGPLVRIEPYNYLYIKVKLEDCEEIYNETILGGRPVERLLYKMDGVTYPSQEEIPFYAKQTRLVLGRYYDQRQGHGNLHVERFLECQEKILDTNENLLYDSTGDK